jgi:hypothetical protein
MLLILYMYLFNFLFYSVSVFLALLIMEKFNKKRPSTLFDRAGLAMVLASGVTMLQLIVNAVSMVYRGWVH